MKRDLSLMLAVARKRRIPLVVGTAGGSGGEPHLKLTADIVREIARERGPAKPSAAASCYFSAGKIVRLPNHMRRKSPSFSTN